ncbi:MAG: prepilin-type N-terminal cleavage/methylation domain-containing protein [Gloeobacteraceae cyanobacterium ES-bin-144]|nr:prepilin-type N-terminal cleavage/methylation domain-containing protein [Verrucomicrobiales bacterium]
MKTQRITSSRRGFTLLELMVAMAITTIIVTVLVSVTSVAIDTWNRSRSELRASRQAKAMVDTMAKDFESMVIRSGNANEWLSATSPTALPGNNMKSSNAAELIFFSAATDRYKGAIGTATDLGGDVSGILYKLDYKDAIDASGTYPTFVLKRLLIDPNTTFTTMLGKTDLTPLFTSNTATLDKVQNFVCENVFQFTVTFWVQISRVNTTTTKTDLLTVPVTVGQSASTSAPVTKSFKVKGTGIVSTAVSGVTVAELQAGRITGVEISLSVLTDAATEQVRRRAFSGSQATEFLKKNSYQYSKRITVPSN